MGVRIIIGLADGDTDAAVLYDSVTETAFGPVIRHAYGYEGHEQDPRIPEELAEDFLTYLGERDARSFEPHQLDEEWSIFLRQPVS